MTVFGMPMVLYSASLARPTVLVALSITRLQMRMPRALGGCVSQRCKQRHDKVDLGKSFFSYLIPGYTFRQCWDDTCGDYMCWLASSH